MQKAIETIKQGNLSTEAFHKQINLAVGEYGPYAPERIQLARIAIESLDVNPNVRTLCLSHTMLDEETVNTLCRILEKNTTLRTIDVSECCLGNWALLLFANALKRNTSLTELYYGNNQIFVFSPETFSWQHRLRSALRRPLIWLRLTQPNMGDNAFDNDRHYEALVSIERSLAHHRFQFTLVVPATLLAANQDYCPETQTDLARLPLELIYTILSYCDPRYTRDNLDKLNESIQKIKHPAPAIHPAPLSFFHTKQTDHSGSNRVFALKLLSTLCALAAFSTLTASYALTGSAAMLAPYALLGAVVSLLCFSLAQHLQAQPQANQHEHEKVESPELASMATLRTG